MADGQDVDQMIDEPNEDDQKILDEIAEEEAAEKAKAEPADEPEDDPLPEKKEKGADGADKPDKDGEDPKEDDPADGEEDDPEDDADKKEETGRKPKFVPLEKHKKTRAKLKETQQELADLKAKPDAKTPEDKKEVEEAEAKVIKDFADDLGVSEDKVKSILKLSEDNAHKRLKAEMGDKIANLEEAGKLHKQETEDAKQESIFQKQFTALTEQFPDEAKHIKSIKTKIKELAFSEKYASADLDVIYRGVEGLRTKKSKTVESGKGGSSRGDEGIDTKDFKRIVEENDQSALLSMDKKTFAEFEKYVIKHKL